MAEPVWSRAEDIRLYHLIFTEKVSNAEAGDALGRTANSVTLRLYRLELRRPDYLRISKQREGGCKRAFGAIWTEAEVDALKQLRLDGATAKQCAMALGRSDIAVKRYCTSHGIKAQPFWRAERDESIIDGASNQRSAAEIADKLGVAVNSVRLRAKKLGVSLRHPQGMVWTLEMNTKLSQMRQKGCSVDQIVNETGYPRSAIRKQIRRMGIGGGPRNYSIREWSKKDEDTLRELWAKRTPTKKMCLVLGRTAGAISCKRVRLGLQEKGAKARWSQDQDDFLFESDKSVEELALELGRSVGGVKQRLAKLTQDSKVDIRVFLSKLHTRQQKQCGMCPRRIPPEWMRDLGRVVRIDPDGNDEVENLQMVCTRCLSKKA